jgi:hypothetical protein
VIDRPPTQGPGPDQGPAPIPPPDPPRRRGVYLGPVRITPAFVLVSLALGGSAAFILYVVTQVEDQQIPLLGAGFGVMGASFAAIAIGCLFGIWRAAARARAGRALGLAIVGGVAGMIAIGCFAFTVVSGLLSKS